jgi:hypothetical protein
MITVEFNYPTTHLAGFRFQESHTPMGTDTTHTDTLAPNTREVFADLCASLPKSAADTEEAIAARARRALDAVFALHPENAFEARLATRIVAMDAHALDALRAAANAVADPWEMRRCRAQAASMARQSDSALRTLRRMQAERDKAFNEGHPATLGRAGYWFYSDLSGFNMLDGHNPAVPGSGRGYRKPANWRSPRCPRSAATQRLHRSACPSSYGV